VTLGAGGFRLPQPTTAPSDPAGCPAPVAGRLYQLNPDQVVGHIRIWRYQDGRLVQLSGADTLSIGFSWDTVQPVDRACIRAWGGNG
jgi:hypothetical protein